METSKSIKLRALRAAFPHTIPILAGFLFLGFTYGVYMRVSGFAFWYPMLTSITVFGGSLEFIIVNLLLGAFNPLQAFAMTLMVQARHLFYGISMLDKYRNLGKKKLYMIFGLCDESFSINCSVNVPHDVDRGWFYFFVTLLNQLYWITGCVLGSLLGAVLPFSTEGIAFSMTALFIASFTEQWLRSREHLPAVTGFLSTLLCLLIFGPDNFLIPAMLVIMLVLTLSRSKLEGKGDAL